jgi:tetratricopeptide (TPR) repeat protein
VATLLDGDPAVPNDLVALGLRVQGGQEAMLGRTELAVQHWEQALAIDRRLGNELGAAILLHRLGHTAVLQGDLARGRALAEESLASHRRTGFRKGEAHVLTTQADIARAEGDFEGALELLHEARRIAEETRFRWWLSGVHAKIGAASLELGRFDDAERSARDALSLSRAMKDRRALVYELALLAEINAKTGAARHAGTLWGAAEAEHERMWVGAWLFGTVEPDRMAAHADDEFEQGRSVGRELSLEDAVALAVEGGLVTT